MGENLRQNIPSPSPDLESMERCRSGLTRTNSEASSALTVDTSKHFLNHNAISTPGPSTDWTDEKHSLYLDSLEASFVNQLHQSIGLLTSCSQEKMCDANSSGKLPANTRNSSDQFTVLRHGSWQKLKFERSSSLLDSAADSYAILKNPWVRHFRSACHTVTTPDVKEQSVLSSKRVHLSEKRTFSRGLATGPEQFPVSHLCRQDSVGSITEVSDQNFEDEDQGDKPSSSSLAKRLKTDSADSSSKDQVMGRIDSVSSIFNMYGESHFYPLTYVLFQVVPFGKFHMTEVLNVRP